MDINKEVEKILKCSDDNICEEHCAVYYRPAVTALIERLVAEARREALEEAAIFVTQRDRLEFSTGALGRHHIAEAIRALASEAGKGKK